MEPAVLWWMSYKYERTINAVTNIGESKRKTKLRPETINQQNRIDIRMLRH